MPKIDYYFLLAENCDTFAAFPVVNYLLDSGVRALKSLTNYYSPIYVVPHNKALDPDFSGIIEFFRKLKSDCELFSWDIMELRPLSEEDAAILSSYLDKAGISSISFFCFGNWYFDVNGCSFEEYFVSLSSQVKNTVKRKTKQFYKYNDARVAIITSGHDLKEATESYNLVYKSSWKHEEPYPDFMPGLIRVAKSGGALRLGIVYIGSKPIAAQLWIVADRTAYIFKLAYDENYKQYSVGTVLTAKLMEYVIDQDKVEVVDYLCGDDAYKEDWMPYRRIRLGLLAFNTTRLRGIIEMLKEMSKFYIKNTYCPVD